jgi:hypothetical protein
MPAVAAAVQTLDHMQHAAQTWQKVLHLTLTQAHMRNLEATWEYAQAHCSSHHAKNLCLTQQSCDSPDTYTNHYLYIQAVGAGCRIAPAPDVAWQSVYCFQALQEHSKSSCALLHTRNRLSSKHAPALVRLLLLLQPRSCSKQLLRLLPLPLLLLLAPCQRPDAAESAE